MKPLIAIVLALGFDSAVFALTLGDRSWFAALKEADLIVVGTATKMEIIEDPKASRKDVYSHGRLKVKVSRVVLPADAKSEGVVDVDFGYNVGGYAADGYIGRELVYVLKQKEKNSDGLIIRGQALRWWLFAYRREDLDQVLELRKKLQGGADPKMLQNDRPKELFSAR